MRKLPTSLLDEQRRIAAYLDGLHAEVNVLRELQLASGEELSPSLRYGDATQSALMPSILDKGLKEEL
jgi:hypothetical protein